MDSREPSRSAQYVSDLELSIRRYPLQSLGIGFLTGFVVGGGQRSPLGQGLIGFAARLAVRQAARVAISQTLRQL